MDIFYSHNKNLFSVDEETIRISRQANEVFLRAFWTRERLWMPKLSDTDGRGLEEADIDSLINCLLSLLDGRPGGSRQKNLVEVLNIFLNVERRYRFARLVRRFAELTGRNDVLEVRSVQTKFAAALGSPPRDDPQALPAAWHLASSRKFSLQDDKSSMRIAMS